jgi:hypothetical protein
LFSLLDFLFISFSFLLSSFFGVNASERTSFTSLLQTAQGPRRLRSADITSASSGTTPRAASSSSGTAPRAAFASSGATPRASALSAEFSDVLGA